MTRPAVIGSADDLDFITDLQVIARREPGKGAALRRMLDRAGATQAALAEALHLGRTTVTLWCSEKRWPTDAAVRNALLALNVDRRLILQHFGPSLVASHTEWDPKTLAATVVAALFAVDDPFERERVIYTNMREKILIAQCIKGMTDTRAADYVEQRFRAWTEESRLRMPNSSRDVTPRAAAWVAGDVYRQDHTQPQAIDKTEADS